MIDLDILWAKHTKIFGRPIDNLGQLSTHAGFFIFFLYVHGGVIVIERTTLLRKEANTNNLDVTVDMS